MKKLRWWFHLIGGFYAPLGGIAHRALLDYTFMFGLYLLVIGGFLLAAPRNPGEHVNLIWLVVALEAVCGIFDDLYMILQGYPPAFLLGFIVAHLVIILSGVAFVLGARDPARRKGYQHELV